MFCVKQKRLFFKFFPLHNETSELMGRVKPDISAPGTWIASSVNSFDTEGDSYGPYNSTHPYVVAEIVFPSSNSSDAPPPVLR